MKRKNINLFDKIYKNVVDDFVSHGNSIRKDFYNQVDNRVMETVKYEIHYEMGMRIFDQINLVTKYIISDRRYNEHIYNCELCR